MALHRRTGTRLPIARQTQILTDEPLLDDDHIHVVFDGERRCGSRRLREHPEK